MVRIWKQVGEVVTLASEYGKKLFVMMFENPITGMIDSYVQFSQKNWSVCLAITKDDQVLVVREFKQGRRCVEDELPAGTADEGRPESPIDVMRRELLEETGHRATEMKYLGFGWLNTRNSPTKFHCFLALGCEKVGPAKLDENEEIEWRTVPLRKWLYMCTNGKINEPSAIVTTMRALPHLGLVID